MLHKTLLLQYYPAQPTTSTQKLTSFNPILNLETMEALT